jgi:hypothetical protein
LMCFMFSFSTSSSSELVTCSGINRILEIRVDFLRYVTSFFGILKINCQSPEIRPLRF